MTARTGSLPFLPFVGSHAARIMGGLPDDLYRDANTLAMSLLGTCDLYDLDGLSVGYDLAATVPEQPPPPAAWPTDCPFTLDDPSGQHLSPATRFHTIRDAAAHLSNGPGNLLLQVAVPGPLTLTQTRADGAAQPHTPVASILQTIAAFADDIQILTLVDPRLTERTPYAEDELSSAYARISSLARHYGMLTALYPGRPGDPGALDEFTTWSDILVVDGESVSPTDLPPDAPMVAVGIRPSTFDRTHKDLKDLAARLHDSWTDHPAYLTTLGALAYDCPPETVREFVTLQRQQTDSG
ncbi:MAG: hypothetical protein GEV10_30250 [Streptosporangiales bacterium]|nr:hypothetical protein [Streptosporangiales bacterium]